MLATSLHHGRREAGCDEAGRGPLAGPVVAAAVLLPEGYNNEALDDSKKLTERQREALRPVVEAVADAWAVATVSAEEIDKRNILHASTHAMCMAVKALLGESVEDVVAGGHMLGRTHPEFLLVDGNRFYNETNLPFQTIVGGDAKYMAIAAASILAKTYRDDAMRHLDAEYPGYGWSRNKGYPTAEHYDAIERLGLTPYHRRSFTLYRQHTLF